MTNFAVRVRTGRAAVLTSAAVACLVIGDGANQVSAQGLGRARSNLTGTYQLNTSQSDNPSTVADQVTRSLPGRDRPRLRDQIMQRLDAPTEFAIERRGQTITMASSNADRVTFDADGQAQVEPAANGRSIRTVANLSGDRLEINSTGDRALDYQLTIEPFNNGRNLRVTRRVSHNGLSQPVVSRSVYDRVSADARLDMYSDGGFPTAPDRPARRGNGSRAGAGGGAASNVPEGTEIVATLDTALSTREASAEDPFTLTVVSPAQFQGARIDGRLLAVDRSGRVTGRSDMTFDFDTIRFRNGRTADFDGVIESVQTPDGDELQVENTNVGEDDSQTSRTATRTGIGAAIGGAAGAGSVIVQGRDDLNLEPGSEFRIRALGQ